MAIASTVAQSGGTGGSGQAGPQPAVVRRRGRWTPYWLLTPGMLWLGLLFVLPIAVLFATSLQTRVPGGDVNEFQPDFRVQNYSDSVNEYVSQFGRSFVYAAIATVVALLIAYPLAYMIAFKAGRLRNLLLVLVVAPFFTSFILRTIAWRQILADEGWVVKTIKFLHLVPADTSVTASAFAVVAGITYNFLPFMTLPLYASLERIDPRLIEAGSDLYANGFTVLRKVTIPLSMPGIVAGTLLTFIPAAGDYVNAALLGNTRTQMVGNVIESRFLRIVDYPTAAALSFVLMAAILVLVTLYIRRAGTEELV
jgi:spermidine/putrescine transport system permease protein